MGRFTHVTYIIAGAVFIFFGILIVVYCPSAFPTVPAEETIKMGTWVIVFGVLFIVGGIISWYLKKRKNK